MKQTIYILTVTAALCAILCGGCAHRDALEDALGLAGSNRSELETVLDHYKNDSLKYEAAVFLIKNMPYRYSLVGDERSNLDRFYIAASKSESLPQAVNDSLNAIGVSFNTSKLRVSKDIQSVSSAFLIDHIDKAFAIWRKQPWGKNVDFDTFLNHILPYRVGNEPLRPWIGELHERFDPLLDSIRQTPDSADIVKVTEALVDTLRKMKRHYGHGLPSGVSIGPDNTRWLAGDCREFTDIQTYIMRSVGLPGGCDKMPISGNYFLPHFWNYVIDGDGDTFYCSMLFKTPDAIPASAYPGPKGKVKREKFEFNEALYSRLTDEGNPDNIHPAFRIPTDEDVTILYSGDSIQDAVIGKGLCYETAEKGEPVYACLSSHMNWIPVDVAVKEKDCYRIKDVDGDVVMRLGVYRNGNMRFISNPFLIDKKKRSVRMYEPSDKRKTICLYYKFDDILREGFSKGMVGGVMEGSDFADFRVCDTLHVIGESPVRLYTRAATRSRRPYRYVRYYGPAGGKCYASEVSFYGHRVGGTVNTRLQGECLGTPNFHSDNKYPYTNVVDGDPYTSFVYEKVSGGWVGLDLGKPMVIDTVVYTPRNRRNFIEKGDDYELFYCDRTWKSLGRKTADSDSLLFPAPEGALLYLRNYTRGNQERIFEYSNGKQIFW